MAGEGQRLAGLVRARIALFGERSFVVAIDGRSGAGKSTLAGAVAELLEDCLVVDGDDFYAGGAPEEWDRRTPTEKVAQVIDWKRQRVLLAKLRAGERVEWFGYDWDAFDGRLLREPTVAEPAQVVILEGAYSARPELADMIDLRILAEADDAVRRERLRARDGAEWHDEWFDRWDEAERYYFERVVARNGFDAVLRP